MTQTLRQRRELHAVAKIGKEPPRADWLDPRWHEPDGYQFSTTHNTVDAFRQRQIERGLKPRSHK